MAKIWTALASVLAAAASAHTSEWHAEGARSRPRGSAALGGQICTQRQPASLSLSPAFSVRRPVASFPRTTMAQGRRPFADAVPYSQRSSICNLLMSTNPTVDEASNIESEATPKKAPSPGASEYPLVILIGGSGFLGSEIRHQLQERGLKYLATATPATAQSSGGDYVPLDLTAPDAEEQFYKLIQSSVGDSNNANRVAVISAMGVIGTQNDEEVNAALARAINGAHRANVAGAEDDATVEKFVMIGNTDRVRRLARKVPFLQGYGSGKDEVESKLSELFGSQGCIIKPSFIYGGDEISLSPPRLPSSIGSLASEVLGLYPIQALADELPDALAVPLAPPVSVEMVASAAINVALGIVEGYTDELEGESISMAGSVRGWKEKERYDTWAKEQFDEDGAAYPGSSKELCDIDDMFDIDDERRWKKITALKEKLLRGENDGEDELAIMEQLECLRPQSMKPAYDPTLNGRWNFVLSKEDLGTQFIKELLGSDETNDNDQTKPSQPSPPWKALLSNAYQLKGLYMRIHDEQSQVEIVLSSSLFFGQLPIDIVFQTSLLSTNYDEATEGTLFLEKFEGITVGGISLPMPSSWQRYRYLEITFLDDEIIIARGSGGEPHVLVRAND